MTTKIRFTFLCTEEQKADLFEIAEYMHRTPSDAIRELIGDKKKTIGSQCELQAPEDLSQETTLN
jgi:hypothetical protein